MSTDIRGTIDRVREQCAADYKAIESGKSLTEQVAEDEARVVYNSFKQQDGSALFGWPCIRQAKETITAKLVELQALAKKDGLPRELSAMQAVLLELQTFKVIEASRICEIAEQYYGIGSVSETRADALAGKAPEDKSQTIDECYETAGKIFHYLANPTPSKQ